MAEQLDTTLVVQQGGALFETAYYSQVVGLILEEFFCEGKPGTLSTDKGRRIRKVNTIVATGEFVQGKAVQWANGSSGFDNFATSLAVVSAYTYLP